MNVKINKGADKGEYPFLFSLDVKDAGITRTYRMTLAEFDSLEASMSKVRRTILKQAMAEAGS